MDTKLGTAVAQSYKAVAKPVSGRTWTQEELRTLRTKYGMYSNLPRSLLMLFPGWSLTEIDAKAMELGLIKNVPNRPNDVLGNLGSG